MRPPAPSPACSTRALSAARLDRRGSLAQQFSALSTAESPEESARPAPRLFARVDTLPQGEAAELAAAAPAAGQSTPRSAAASDVFSRRLQGKVAEMHERRRLARKVGVKAATADGRAKGGQG